MQDGSGIWSPENAGALWLATMAFGLVFFAFWIYLHWRIFSKAGFPGALALVNLAVIVPIVGPFVVLGLWGWLAFAEWPIAKRAKGAASAA
jgi:hypothetical protein